jgi:hypothetical protein
MVASLLVKMVNGFLMKCQAGGRINSKTTIKIEKKRIEEDSAATKLQASFKGYKARADAKILLSDIKLYEHYI